MWTFGRSDSMFDLQPIQPDVDLQPIRPDVDLWIGAGVLCVQFLREELGFDVVAVPFRDAYKFGGSFHCQSVDVHRDGVQKSYFPNLDIRHERTPERTPECTRAHARTHMRTYAHACTCMQTSAP